MGQYYRVVNLDKKEFLKPHSFDQGAKLLEFVGAPDSIMAALGLLLADGNGRGGGDANDHPLIGSWAGCRIVVTGDYADEGKFTMDPRLNVYQESNSDLYTDISGPALAMLRAADNY